MAAWRCSRIRRMGTRCSGENDSAHPGARPKKKLANEFRTGRNYCDMSASGPMAKRKNPEKRAPGWQVRCLQCDFIEPWGKYGVRLKAVGRTYTFGRCPQCKRIRIHVIEKVPPTEV
jgi:hypothetical protein